MSEFYSNGGSALVGAGGITAVGTTLPVTAQAGLPATGSFRILIGSEILQVTVGGQASSSWTVVRGTESTTAAAYTAGTAITQPLTAGGLAAGLVAGGMTNPMTASGDIIYGGSGGTPTTLAKGSNTQVLTLAAGVPSWATPSGGGGSITEGPIASLPSPGTAGRLYLPTDDIVAQADNGTSWLRYGPIFPLPQWPSGGVAGVVSGLSWDNQNAGGGNATMTVVGNKFTVYVPSNGNTNAITCAYMSTPSTPWSLTVAMLSATILQRYHDYGLCFRESSNSSILACGGEFQGTNQQVLCRLWTNSTTFSGNDYASAASFFPTGVIWVKLGDNGTNKYFQASMDGVNFVQLYSSASASNLTANQVGFYVKAQNPDSPAIPLYLNILSWLWGTS